jgi:hypothetical protein
MSASIVSSDYIRVKMRESINPGNISRRSPAARGGCGHRHVRGLPERLLGDAIARLGNWYEGRCRQRRQEPWILAIADRGNLADALRAVRHGRLAHELGNKSASAALRPGKSATAGELWVLGIVRAAPGAPACPPWSQDKVESCLANAGREIDERLAKALDKLELSFAAPRWLEREGAERETGDTHCPGAGP